MMISKLNQQIQIVSITQNGSLSRVIDGVAVEFPDVRFASNVLLALKGGRVSRQKDIMDNIITETDTMATKRAKEELSGYLKIKTRRF